MSRFPVLALLVLPSVFAAPSPRHLRAAEPPPRITLPTLRGADGQAFRPFDRAGTKAVVVVFLSFKCPVARDYVEPLAKLAKEYDAKGVTVVGVVPNDTPEAVAKAAGEYGATFPLFADRGLAVVDALSAGHTPEAVVLDADRVQRYRGRIVPVRRITWGCVTGFGPGFSRAAGAREIVAGGSGCGQAAEAGRDVLARVRSRQRSGRQSSNWVVEGFSPRANSPGRASFRYASGSIPRCLHVPTTEYRVAAVRPPASLPNTPQLPRLCGAPHNRGNWLHVGGDGGLKTASVLLSICASTTRHRLNPWSYLRDVLDQLAVRPVGADLSDLLPGVAGIAGNAPGRIQSTA